MTRRACLGLVPLLLLALPHPGCTCKRTGSAVPGRGSAVVVVDPEESGRPEPVPEQEPDDRAQQAQVISRERGVEGTLTEGDRDWYRVVLDAPRPEPSLRPSSPPASQPPSGSPPGGQVLGATLSGVAGADLVLEAFSEKRERLVRIDNSGLGEGEVLVNLTVGTSGDAPAAERACLLLVREAKGRPTSGRYRLSYSLRPAEEGEEREPNWKAPIASALPLEGEAIGYLGWKTDTDWYRVDVSGLAPAARLRVEYDGLDEVRANLSLRGTSGVLQERWGGTGEAIALTNLAIGEGQKELFVVVRTQTHFNVESRYSVRVVSAAPPGPTEAEPNDRPELATPVAPGVPMAGLLGDTRDRDLFSVKANEPSVIRVEVIPPLNLDAALAVLDEAGRVIWEIDAGKAREPEILPHLNVRPPRALLQVRAPRGSSVSPVAPYHLKVSAAGEGSYEREPNPDLSAATPWPAAAEQMLGTIHPRGDVDWYRVAVSGDRLRLRAEGAKLRLKLELFGADASPLASTAADAGGVARVDAPAPGGGELLLKVSETSGAAGPLEPYRLLREKP